MQIHRFRIIIVLVACLSAISLIDAQKVLLLEKRNDPKTKKFFIGSTLSYKVASFPEEWRKGKIENILIEEGYIVFTDALVSIDEIIELKSYRGWARAANLILTRFGATWWILGGIVHFYDDNISFGWDTLLIGAGAMLSGILIKKLFYTKRYKMGKKWRLRILDISFPSDPYGNSGGSQ